MKLAHSLCIADASRLTVSDAADVTDSESFSLPEVLDVGMEKLNSGSISSEIALNDKKKRGRKFFVTLSYIIR